MVLYRFTMMPCDDSKSTESNRIASYRLDQGDIEPIDHDAL